MQKLLIWPKEVTLVSRTEPSGPLCLWQRLNNYGTTYWSITPRPSTVSNVRFTFVYDLPRISIFWLVTWISNKEKTTYFLPRKVQSAEPWHPYYEKCLSTFHLLLLHIFDFTWTYIQFGRQCFWLHCCKWYVATWEHWCQKAFSRVSDEPGKEAEDKMYSCICFNFWLPAQNWVIRINILLTLSLVLKSLCTFLHLGQMILLPLLPWTFPLVTAQVHNGVHEDVGGGTSSEQQWRRQRIYIECRQWSFSS